MKKLPSLTPPEFAIMNAIWNSGGLPISGIMKAVNSNIPKKLTRSTIQVQVRRLEQKGWLTHLEEGKIFIFKATIPREKASTNIVKDINKRVFGGSFSNLIKCLFNDEENISSDELDKIRSIIDKFEDKQ